MTPQEFQIASAALADHQRLIAAGKTQRWDVVKWAVTINLALVAAAIASQYNFFSASILVTFFGAVLILYYNLRLTRTRIQSNRTSKYLIDNGINLSSMLVQPTYSDDLLQLFWYDREELIAFGVILILSVVPVWFVN